MATGFLGGPGGLSLVPDYATCRNRADTGLAVGKQCADSVIQFLRDEASRRVAEAQAACAATMAEVQAGATDRLRAAERAIQGVGDTLEARAAAALGGVMHLASQVGVEIPSTDELLAVPPIHLPPTVKTPPAPPPAPVPIVPPDFVCPPGALCGPARPPFPTIPPPPPTPAPTPPPPGTLPPAPPGPQPTPPPPGSGVPPGPCPDGSYPQPYTLPDGTVVYRCVTPIPEPPLPPAPPLPKPPPAPPPGPVPKPKPGPDGKC